VTTFSIIEGVADHIFTLIASEGWTHSHTIL
jgi:hypothetical protein